MIETTCQVAVLTPDMIWEACGAAAVGSMVLPSPLAEHLGAGETITVQVCNHHRRR